MVKINGDKRKSPFIHVVFCVLFLVYEATSVYATFKILPNGGVGTLLRVIVGGVTFFGFIYPLVFFVELSDDSAKVNRYIGTVLISLFSIPILLYGAYFVKLKVLDDYDYSIADEKCIHCKISGELVVNDSKDPNSKWEVYFTNTNGDRIEETIDIDRYDALSLVANIICKSHSIKDVEYPSANLNDSTVRRRVDYFFTQDNGNRIIRTGNINVQDANGNDIKVQLRTIVERTYSVWEVLSAKTIKKPKLELFDILGRDCSEIKKNFWNEEGTRPAGTGSDVQIYSSDEGVAVFFPALLLDKYVDVELDVNKIGVYESVNAETAFLMQNTESKDYMAELKELAFEKYGKDGEKIISTDDCWAYSTQDKMIIIERTQEEEGLYSVYLYVALRKFFD